MRFRLAILALAVSAVLSSAGCSSPKAVHEVPAARAPRPEPDELVIVATTDFHAALGRAEGLAKVIRGLRAVYGDQMLYLDGGDLFQGSLEGNLSKGRSIIDLYNKLGIDAAAIGNHDLDYGPDAVGRISPKPHEDGMGNLKARARQARFSWLSANLVRPSARVSCHPHVGATIEHCNALGSRTIFPPHAVFMRAGRKVCVIGATTPSTPSITRPEFIRNARFLDLKPVIEAESEFLRDNEGCELVLLAVHAGLLCKSVQESAGHINDGYCREGGDRAELLRLLGELPKGTVDAVVGGHTHLLAQEAINGTPVVEAGTGARNVAVLHLAGRHGSLRVKFEPFLTVPETASEPDITAVLKPYRDSADEQRRRPSGSTAGAFPKNYGAETALGNLIADSLLAAGSQADGAQFALINAGGIRASLPAGPLTYGDVFNVVPFDNALAVVELTGAELRRVLEIAFSGGHGISGVAGLHLRRVDLAPGARAPQGAGWSRDLNGDGQTEDWERNLLLELTDDKGVPIDDSKTYKLATLDFLVTGGDHQLVAYASVPESRKHIFTGVWVRDIVTEFLKNHPDVNPKDFYDPAHPRVVQVPVDAH